MRKQKKLKKLSKRLEKLIEKLLKKGEINQKLLYFIRDFPEKERQAQFWERILSRKDLIPYNLYVISQLIDVGPLKIKTQQKYAKMAPDDDLLDALRTESPSFQEIIWLELCQRIQKYVKKHRTREQAIEILKKVFENIEKYRDRAWQVLKFLGLPDDALQRLSALSFMYSQPDLQAEIQSLIRKRRLRWRHKDYNATLIGEIQKTMAKIAELKREQE